MSALLKGRKSFICGKIKYGNKNVHCFGERKSVQEVPMYIKLPYREFSCK